MALPAQPTLATITQEVLSLLGEGGAGVATPALITTVQAFARRAQSRLYHKANWLINRTRFSVTVPGTGANSPAPTTTTIDWPDTILPGHITRMSAVRVLDPKYEWTLEAGISPDDRSTWNFGGFSTWTFTPFKYDIHDGTIELGPTNVQDTTIFIQGDMAPSPLLADGDRPGCDGEALIMLAAIMTANRLGGDYRDAIPSMKEDFEEYLRLIRPRQGDGEVIIPGTVWAAEDPAKLGNWRSGSQRHWMTRDRRP